MKDDAELIEDILDWYNDSCDHLKDWRAEARRCYDFRAGKQLSDKEKAELEAALRPDIAFNRIDPMVSAVTGHQINNRQEVRYLPRQLGDSAVNEVLTGAAKWVDDECYAEDELTEITDDLLVTGMAWSETRIGYDEDIDGKIYSIERISPLEMGYDPSCTRQNLAGSKYRQRARWTNRKDAETKWPELKDIEAQGLEIIDGDSQQEQGLTYAEGSTHQWYRKHTDEVLILQTQWWEHVPVWRVGEPGSGRLVELDEAKYNKLKPRLEKMGIKAVRQLKKRYFQAFSCGENLLEKGENACPDEFTLLCVTGKRDETQNYWYGIVRGMIDPQRWANKFYSDIQDMIVSNRQGGAFVEESALINPRKAEEIWNDPNPLILVADGSLARGAIMERNPAPYPQGMDRMLEWAVQALPAVTGINMEMMGLADREQANVLEMQRKRSALTVLAQLFNSLRRFQKERGRVVLYFIQEYINDGRLIRIVGGDGLERYVPLALDKDAVKYDTIVDEASSSPNQKQEVFGVLVQLLPWLAKAGITPPAEVLDYVPLPSSLVQSIKKGSQDKAPDPMQQAMMAEQMKKVEELDSKVQLNTAKAKQAEAEAAREMMEVQMIASGAVHPADL